MQGLIVSVAGALSSKKSKCASSFRAEQLSLVISMKKMRKRVIGSANVESITIAVKQKSKANVLATRFYPDQGADDLK